MKKQNGFTEVTLVFAIIGLLGVGGWIANIVKIIGSDFAHITTILILRFIGIFLAPLGAILGFF